MEIAVFRVDENRCKVLCQVVDRGELMVRFVPDVRPAQEVVGDKQVVVVKHRPDESAQAAFRFIYAVVQDPAVAGVYGHDSRLWCAGDKVVPNDTARAVSMNIFGPMGIAQTNSRVAVDDDVSLDNTIPRLVPHKYRPAPLLCPSLDVDKYIIANRPVPRKHHVNAADVIAVEIARRVGRIIGKSLGTIVIKHTV